MPLVQPSALNKSIKSDDFRPEPVYLLYGSESKRVREAAGVLTQRITDILGGDNRYHYLRAGAGQDETAPGEIISQLNTVSMFGRGKVAWVGPLEGVNKEVAKAMADYASDPNPDSSLIISVITPKGDARALTVFDKSAFVKTMTEKGVVARFEPYTRKEIKKWVAKRLREKGITIDSEALERLVELTDKDMEKLSGEVEKLTAYVGGDGAVTREAVEAAVGDHRAAKIWDLTKAVRRRNVSSALICLGNLMENNVPYQMILKLLATDTMRLASALSHKKRGESFDSFKSAAGGSVFPLKEAWVDANEWRPHSLLRFLRAILQTNLDIMRSGLAPETALFALISGLRKKG